MARKMLVAPLLLAVLMLIVEGNAFQSQNGGMKVHHLKVNPSQIFQSLAVRGGATLAEDEDESEDESESEDEELDPVLTKSAIKSTSKVQTKKATATKEALSSKLKKPTRKQSGGLLKAMKVPYIVRVCMNPFTVFAMTKAYFASLMNLNFLKEEDSSQNLRSAMEEKAKRAGGSGGRKKGKRQMRPGQAKTLSDLPQLSA